MGQMFTQNEGTSDKRVLQMVLIYCDRTNEVEIPIRTQISLL